MKSTLLIKLAVGLFVFLCSMNVMSQQVKKNPIVQDLPLYQNTGDKKLDAKNFEKQKVEFLKVHPSYTRETLEDLILKNHSKEQKMQLISRDPEGKKSNPSGKPMPEDYKTNQAYLDAKNTWIQKNK